MTIIGGGRFPFDALLECTVTIDAGSLAVDGEDVDVAGLASFASSSSIGSVLIWIGRTIGRGVTKLLSALPF
jgi:hypothetical protein